MNGPVKRLLLAWLVMLAVSVLNGIARDAGYGRELIHWSHINYRRSTA